MDSTAFRAELSLLRMTQRGFAAAIGVNERTVRRWASGELELPKWAMLLILAWRTHPELAPRLVRR